MVCPAPARRTGQLVAALQGLVGAVGPRREAVHRRTSTTHRMLAVATPRQSVAVLARPASYSRAITSFDTTTCRRDPCDRRRSVRHALRALAGQRSRPASIEHIETVPDDVSTTFATSVTRACSPATLTSTPRHHSDNSSTRSDRATPRVPHPHPLCRVRVALGSTGHRRLRTRAILAAAQLRRRWCHHRAPSSPQLSRPCALGYTTHAPVFRTATTIESAHLPRSRDPLLRRHSSLRSIMLTVVRFSPIPHYPKLTGPTALDLHARTTTGLRRRQAFDCRGMLGALRLL